MPVVYHRVEPNQGYGNGVLKSIPVCRAPWVGIIPADGQVDAEDVARLFEAVKHTSPRCLGKVRRRFRMDGPLRKIVSIFYNGFVWLLWPRLGSIDINGSPKIVPRDVLLAMDLQSKQWFLDPELMVKAHHMGVRVLEMNVFARMRGNGLSHVRPTVARSRCAPYRSSRSLPAAAAVALAIWAAPQSAVAASQPPQSRSWPACRSGHIS
jgi:hypothetical protein